MLTPGRDAIVISTKFGAGSSNPNRIIALAALNGQRMNQNRSRV